MIDSYLLAHLHRSPPTLVGGSSVFNRIHSHAITTSTDPTMLAIEIKITLVRRSASSQKQSSNYASLPSICPFRLPFLGRFGAVPVVLAFTGADEKKLC